MNCELSLNVITIIISPVGDACIAFEKEANQQQFRNMSVTGLWGNVRLTGFTLRLEKDRDENFNTKKVFGFVLRAAHLQSF